MPIPCFNALHQVGVEVGGEVVLVNPGQVVTCMKRVPRGRPISLLEICSHLQRDMASKGAVFFILTAAHAAQEAK
jgi:hypothetical protein